MVDLSSQASGRTDAANETRLAVIPRPKAMSQYDFDSSLIFANSNVDVNHESIISSVPCRAAAAIAEALRERLDVVSKDRRTLLTATPAVERKARPAIPARTIRRIL
jgi:hypothetical protein